jgi:hypothetical protein
MMPEVLLLLMLLVLVVSAELTLKAVGLQLSVGSQSGNRSSWALMDSKKRDGGAGRWQRIYSTGYKG